MSKFYETESESRWWLGITGRIILGVILVTIAGGAFFAFRVAMSGVVGRGEQIEQNNSNINRTGKQEMFEELNGDIKAYGVQIRNVAAGPSDDHTATVLTGLLNQCTSVVEQYNAESRKITSQDWKSIDLPQTLDASELCARPTTGASK